MRCHLAVLYSALQCPTKQLTKYLRKECLQILFNYLELFNITSAWNIKWCKIQPCAVYVISYPEDLDVSCAILFHFPVQTFTWITMQENLPEIWRLTFQSKGRAIKCHKWAMIPLLYVLHNTAVSHFPESTTRETWRSTGRSMEDPLSMTDFKCHLFIEKQLSLTATTKLKPNLGSTLRRKSHLWCGQTGKNI